MIETCLNILARCYMAVAQRYNMPYNLRILDPKPMMMGTKWERSWPNFLAHGESRRMFEADRHGSSGGGAFLNPN